MYPLLVVFPEILALGSHYVTAFARCDARAIPSICTTGDHLHLRRLRQDELADRYACPTLAHADVSEFRHRILMQRPASPFVISNAVRGTWLGAGIPPRVGQIAESGVG